MKHGPIRLSKNRKYLVHADGTPFFWLADTWWYGATDRTPMSVFKSLVKKRKSQGFSAVQIVVGIPPETDVRGFSFNKDLSLDKEYFDEVDKKIKYLVDNGIVPVIFGGWGHHIDILGIENVKKLWREIVRRYAHYPVIFCLAGEIDIDRVAIRHSGMSALTLSTPLKEASSFLRSLSLRERVRVREIFWMLSPAVDGLITRMTLGSKVLKNRIKKWSEVGNYISKIDPYKRPITAHVSRKTTAHDLLGNKKWLSINSIQSGHSKDSVSFMVNSIKKSVAIKVPIINMEPWYEGILGNFGAYEQRLAFWMCIISGAKGHSYGAHGIWQMSKTGENFMKHWGKSYWKKSFKFGGAEQLGLAKKFLEKYEWWKLEPDFDRVNPHWTEDNVYLPVSAKIENRHYFIYIPRVREVSPSTLRLRDAPSGASLRSGLRIKEIGVKDLKEKTFYKASFMDPKSMRVFDSFEFKGKECIIPIRKTNTEDLLLIISRR